MKKPRGWFFFFKALSNYNKDKFRAFSMPNTEVLPTTDFWQETGFTKWTVIKILKEGRQKNESKKKERK